VDGVALCRMFQQATRRHGLPKYLSSDHDPLYRFHQWQANLRVLEVKEIKTVPHVPLSHPFVERLIGTIRREYLDRTLFWTAADLEEAIRFSKLGSAQESGGLMGFRWHGGFRYTAWFEKQRLDKDSGLAGLPGVSERDRRTGQDAETMGAAEVWQVGLLRVRPERARDRRSL